MKEDTPNLLAVRPGSSYDVGYAKPPVATRFKPGQSGNPKGRPKGSKNKRPGLHEERMKEIILDEAYRDVTVRDGHRNVTIPMAQAVVRSMAVNAAKGQHKAQRLFSHLLAAVETSRKALHDEYLDKAMTYKIEWDRELRRRQMLGITDQPDPIPHPDHIQIDMNTGLVRIVGPMTKEEKAEIEYWRKKLPKLRENLEDLREALAIETDPEEMANLETHIRMGEQLCKKLSKALGAVSDT